MTSADARALAVAVLASVSVAQGARAEGAEPVRVLVVDLVPKGAVEPHEAELLSEVVATHLGAYANAAVISGADVRELIALEADKQTAGCDDESCLSEIAGALGASLIVSGQVGTLGKRYVVTLSLIDSTKARSLGRQTVELDDIESAPVALRPAVERLVVPIRARLGERAENDRPLTFWGVTSGVFTWTGWGVLAAGALTFVVQHAIFYIATIGLEPTGAWQTAWVPVCGPAWVFLVAGANPSLPYSDELSSLGFACCVTECCSCGLVGIAPLILSGGLLSNLLDSEEGDATASAWITPLDDAHRQTAQLNGAMAF